MSYSRAAWLTLAAGMLLVIGAGCVGSASKQALEESGDRGAAMAQPAPGEGAGDESMGGDSEMRVRGEETTDEGLAPPSGGSDAMMEEGDAGTSVGADVVREISMTVRSFEFVPSEVRVKEGERVRLVITNEDVPHGIAIPAFNVNQHIDEGGTATVEFTADKAGEYPFFCNVFCGSGHRDMRGSLIVE